MDDFEWQRNAATLAPRWETDSLLELNRQANGRGCGYQRFFHQGRDPYAPFRSPHRWAGNRWPHEFVGPDSGWRPDSGQHRDRFRRHDPDYHCAELAIGINQVIAACSV